MGPPGGAREAGDRGRPGGATAGPGRQHRGGCTNQSCGSIEDEDCGDAQETVADNGTNHLKGRPWADLRGVRPAGFGRRIECQRREE